MNDTNTSWIKATEKLGGAVALYRCDISRIHIV